VAQCVWWLASIIGLEQGLVSYIDNLQSRIEVRVVHEESETVDRETVSLGSRDIQEEDRQDKILKECEDFLGDSGRQRKIAALKATGRTSTGLINPTSDSKKVLKRKNRSRQRVARDDKESKVVGIDKDELRRRKSAGECLRCAWPIDKKGGHRVADCRRPIRLERGTHHLRAKGFSEIKQVPQPPPVEDESSESNSFEESSDSDYSL